jgi:bacteriocin-like protein
MRERIRQYSKSNDRHVLNEIVASLYRISANEMAQIEGGKVQ